MCKYTVSSYISYSYWYDLRHFNSFRQVTGRKKWWFIPPDQTIYLKPSINVNGFSAHTKTQVGKGGMQPSPWLSKVVRYTSTLNPGDVLVNPPWFWHGIINQGEVNSTDLVIGSPVRYGKGAGFNAGFKNNFFFSSNAFLTLFRKYGSAAFKPNFKMNLQADIANNRRKRENKELHADGLNADAKHSDLAAAATSTTTQELHPFDEAD